MVVVHLRLFLSLVTSHATNTAAPIDMAPTKARNPMSRSVILVAAHFLSSAFGGCVFYLP